MDLPKWQCHKIVQAAQIVAIEPLGTIGGRQASLDGDVTVYLPAPMTVRYEPVVGDYYVIYEDGYASISPKKAFEEGYSPLPPPSPQQAYADRLSHGLPGTAGGNG